MVCTYCPNPDRMFALPLPFMYKYRNTRLMPMVDTAHGTCVQLAYIYISIYISNNSVIRE